MGGRKLVLMMKNEISRVLVVAIFMLLAGCTTMGSGNLENLNNVQQQLLGDLPLPQGAKIDNAQSLILGSGSTWTGRAALVTAQGPTESFAFFNDQLPTAGWTGISSIKAKTSILVFVKQERTVTIEISDAGSLSGGALVLLTMAPKSGTSAPNQSPSGARPPR